MRISVFLHSKTKFCHEEWIHVIASTYFSKEEGDELRGKMKAADEMEVNDDEMPTFPILPKTESTPAADLFPDDMIDDEDTELIRYNNLLRCVSTIFMSY